MLLSIRYTAALVLDGLVSENRFFEQNKSQMVHETNGFATDRTATTEQNFMVFVCESRVGANLIQTSVEFFAKQYVSQTGPSTSNEVMSSPIQIFEERY